MYIAPGGVEPPFVGFFKRRSCSPLKARLSALAKAHCTGPLYDGATREYLGLTHILYYCTAFFRVVGRLGNMKKHNFGRGFFDDDFFAGFDKIEEMMRDMLDSHFEHFDEADLKKMEGTRPKVYGFTLEFGPEGKGRLTEFGASPGVQRQEQKKNEPFVEVINHPENVTVIAELPGVDEKHLDVKAFAKQLSLRVTDPQRLFSKTVVLPAEVDPKTLKRSLKNGILELVLKKA